MAPSRREGQARCLADTFPLIDQCVARYFAARFINIGRCEAQRHLAGTLECGGCGNHRPFRDRLPEAPMKQVHADTGLAGRPNIEGLAERSRGYFDGGRKGRLARQRRKELTLDGISGPALLDGPQEAI